jgi:DNA polymerase/3'-5' exonuclease PolX
MDIELGVTEKNKGQQYKYRAYMTAVNSLKSYPKPIESGKEAQSTTQKSHLFNNNQYTRII